jgi:hypothetical protein
LEEISEENRQQDLEDALTFSNHKGTSAKLVLLKKLLKKDAIHRYSLPIPFLSVESIPGFIMAPMNIMAHNKNNEIRQII